MSLPLSVVGQKVKCPSCGAVNVITAPNSTSPNQQQPLQQQPLQQQPLQQQPLQQQPLYQTDGSSIDASLDGHGNTTTNAHPNTRPRKKLIIVITSATGVILLAILTILLTTGTDADQVLDKQIAVIRTGLQAALDDSSNADDAQRFEELKLAILSQEKAVEKAREIIDEQFPGKERASGYEKLNEVRMEHLKLIYKLEQSAMKLPSYNSGEGVNDLLSSINPVLRMIGVADGNTLEITKNIYERWEDHRRSKRALAQLNLFSRALNLYRIDMGNYPTTDQGLESLVKPPVDKSLASKFRKDGYLGTGFIANDPWQRPYSYEFTVDANSKSSFTISSAGPDKIHGSPDDIVLKQ